MLTVESSVNHLVIRSLNMVFLKSKANRNRRYVKLRSHEKGASRERVKESSVTYASQSEIDASISFLLKEYSETFRRLAE